MAIGLASDFKIYHEYFDLGFTETIAQNVDVFNNRSNGALILRDERRLGDYVYDSFFTEVSNLDTRRDTTSVSAVTPLALAQEELVSVKLNRKQGPVQHTIDAFKKKGMTSEELSMVLGRQSAKLIQQSHLHRALISVVAALAGTSGLLFQNTGDTLGFAEMNLGLAKAGDSFQSIAVWVMHSKAFHNLVGDGIANYKIENVAGAIIASGPISATFGRPIIVTDDAALVNPDGVTSGTDSYYSLGLRSMAVTVEQSEDMTLHTDVVGGLENLVAEWQLEYAMNIGVRGFKYDTAGGANPTDATLGTTSRWDQAFTDIRNLPGVIIETA